jgi:hypothetical protein
VARNKRFALAALVSTALGVGATASIFSLIDAFLLRPLPVRATSRVVRLTSVTQSNPVGRFSYAEVDEIQQRAQSFEGLATSQNALFGFSQRPGEQPRVTVEGRVLAMVLRQGLLLGAIGISVGLLLALALSTVIGDMLNGVNPRDPTVYALGAAVLLTVTLLATYLPARRASQVDPQAALRAE